MKNMRKALVVGIENYLQTPLTGCLKDAELMGKLLEKNANGKRNFSVKVSKNVPKKGTLKSQVYQLFRIEYEVALFYFSGHGYKDEFGFHLVTPDAEPSDVGVSMADIMDIVNDSPAKNKIVILDCCYAGAVAKRKYKRYGDRITILGNGVTVLASCSDSDDALMYSDNGGSVFTSLLIEALKGGAADLDGNITPGSIYAFVDKALGPKQQRPEFKTNICEFISLRKVDPPININILKTIVEFFPKSCDEFKLDPSYEFTNTPTYKIPHKKPYATKENEKKLQQLQAMNRVGLVKPVGAKHMYFAAMNKKSCKLTPLGEHYWRLVKEGRI